MFWPSSRVAKRFTTTTCVVLVIACVWPSMNAASTTLGWADSSGRFRPKLPMPRVAVVLLVMFTGGFTPLPLKPMQGGAVLGNGNPRIVVMLWIQPVVAVGAGARLATGSLTEVIAPVYHLPPMLFR